MTHSASTRTTTRTGPLTEYPRRSRTSTARYNNKHNLHSKKAGHRTAVAATASSSKDQYNTTQQGTRNANSKDKRRRTAAAAKNGSRLRRYHQPASSAKTNSCTTTTVYHQSNDNQLASSITTSSSSEGDSLTSPSEHHNGEFRQAPHRRHGPQRTTIVVRTLGTDNAHTIKVSQIGIQGTHRKNMFPVLRPSPTPAVRRRGLANPMQKCIERAMPSQQEPQCKAKAEVRVAPHKRYLGNKSISDPTAVTTRPPGLPPIHKATPQECLPSTISPVDFGGSKPITLQKW